MKSLLKKLTPSSLLLIPYLLVSHAATAQQPISEEDQKVLKELEQYLDETRKAFGDCPSALVVSRRDSIIFEKYEAGIYAQTSYGPINEESLWPLYSITKSFAAGVLLALASDGILDLDDPASKYLPEFSTHGEGAFDRRKVTIRHLASHTSGASIPKEKYTPTKDNPPDLNLVQIDTEPGTSFLYSALGMHLLERLIQSATGEDFEATLSKKILIPLGLNHTQYIYQVNPLVPILPVRLGESKSPSQNFDLSANGIRCHTGLYSTARELNIYGQIWLGDGTFKGHRYFDFKFKKEAWKHHSTQPSNNAHYGLLWWLSEEKGAYFMSGSGRKVTVVMPQKGVVITLLRLPVEIPKGQTFDDNENLIRFGNQLDQ